MIRRKKKEERERKEHANASLIGVNVGIAKSGFASGRGIKRNSFFFLRAFALFAERRRPVPLNLLITKAPLADPSLAKYSPQWFFSLAQQRKKEGRKVAYFGYPREKGTGDY